MFHRDKPIEKHATNSYASPTPILEGGRVYVHFGTMGTACLDTTTGQVCLAEPGTASSTTRSGPAVRRRCSKTCCCSIATAPTCSTARRSTSGPAQLVWKTNRSGVIDKANDQKKAFVTPLVIQAGERDLVIMTGAEWVYAYDPRTGEEIWNVKHPGFSVAPRPVFGHGLVYRLHRLHVAGVVGDSARGHGRHHGQSDVAWKTDKSVPTKPSPLLVGDELYLVSDVGRGSPAVDATSGKQH